MNVPVIAPPDAGTYELRWDVLHEDVTWFGNKSGLYATSLVTVIPSEGQGDWDKSDFISQPAWDYAGPVPNRTTLWTLGLNMMQERPLFGIGLDNFRLIYGERLDVPYFDNSVHTNNFYLELLVSLGIIGAIPFLFWSAALLVDVLRTLRRPDLTMWQVALAAGLLAFFIHGFLDFFLLFNATGLLFWLLAGLWLSEKRGHAYRI
jgi:O-antigen ligase